MTSVTAMVPMRHSSERVPGKNYRLLGGIPLYHHIVRALLDVPEVTTVVIDTDSPTIFEDCTRSFPEVVLLERPEHLRAGEIPMNDVLLHTTSQVPSDLYLQTHSTNPFLTSATIRRGLRQLLDAGDTYDSLFGVSRIQARLWDKDTKPVNHDPKVLLRTQDLDPIYLENSTIYVFSPDTLREFGNRIGAQPLMFEVPPEESVDIDEESDFTLAEQLWTIRNSA